MSFRIEFQGHFDLTPSLTPDQVEYLTKFSGIRRMKRNESIAEKMEDPTRNAVGLPIGVQGEYFVGGLGDCGQDIDNSVLKDYPPTSQPSYWCHWKPSEDGNLIKWNGCGVAGDDIEWLEYIIKHFLVRWGITANGTVTWCDEECDTGTINVTNNKVTEKFN